MTQIQTPPVAQSAQNVATPAQPLAQQTVGMGEKKSIFSKWWFWLIVAVVLIAIGVGVYFAFFAS